MSSPIPPLCPECGSPAADLSPRKPWWQRRLWTFQFLSLLAFLSWFSWMQWRHWPPPPTMTPQPPRTRYVELPASQITPADLAEMARPNSPASTGTRLLDTFNRHITSPWTPYDEQLHVAFVAPRGHIDTFNRWGWPVAWITRTRDAQYENVYEQTAPSPIARPPGPAGWRGHTWVQATQHPTLGRLELLITPWRAVSTLPVLLAAWFASRGVAAILTRWSRTPASRRRLTRVLPATLLALTLALITWRSLVPYPGDVQPIFPTHRPLLAPTGLTVADLRALRGTPSDATIARAILNATSPANPTRTALAIGWVSPNARSTGQSQGLWPVNAYYSHAVVNNFNGTHPTEPWGPTSWALVSDRIGLHITRAETTGPQRFRQDTFQMAHWTWPILALFAAWLLPAFPARLALWTIHRRARRRAARGDCVHCGYERVRPPRA